MPIPEEQRRFAAEVVRRLREAGFEAYWAGGCVRDQLLGRVPKDYDVATKATPDQVRRLFGRRRTLAIGAAFGVIAVIGPKAAGTVEVTTFRRDAVYSDGRHPDSVAFSSAEEDASRRDFTINGLFYDPIEDCVIDFVGGRSDLQDRRLRAIGDAKQRFAEDKLRMLRAVRFAATFQLTVDADVLQAIRQMAGEIRVVSPERIAMEMRRLLTDAHRATGVQLLLETGLAEPLLPEIVPHHPAETERWKTSLAALSQWVAPCGFPLALAMLLHSAVDPQGARAICRRWRLSNKEADRVVWLVEHGDALREASMMRWSSLQPLLIDEAAEDLLAWAEARGWSDAAAYCRQQIEQRRDRMNPAPLVTGDDLLAEGVPPGPSFKSWLQRIRDAQLDGVIQSKQDALQLVQQWRVKQKE